MMDDAIKMAEIHKNCNGLPGPAAELKALSAILPTPNPWSEVRLQPNVQKVLLKQQKTVPQKKGSKRIKALSAII